MNAKVSLVLYPRIKVAYDDRLIELSPGFRRDFRTVVKTVKSMAKLDNPDARVQIIGKDTSQVCVEIYGISAHAVAVIDDAVSTLCHAFDRITLAGVEEWEEE